MKKIFKVLIIALLGLANSISLSFADETITVTDIAGREVSVPKDPQRIILGEGRMIYTLALLDREQPFARVVGWKDDLIKYDPDAYEKYKAKFPNVDDILVLGSPYNAEFNLEKVIELGTQVAFLDLSNYTNAQESGLITKLEKVGIAVVFIDYREQPTENTVTSIKLFGDILDKSENAQQYIDFYDKNMALVSSKVKDIDEQDKPLVFIENAAGYNPNSCCNTFGNANLGRLVQFAGGHNWGSDKFPGYGGDASPEAIFSDNPDVIFGTGANWAKATPGSQSVFFGYNALQKNVNEQLSRLADRRGWSSLAAVTNKRFYSIYHQFYNSPYNFVAVQVLAKWFYPELFNELDPLSTFVEMHDEFLPIDYSGVFWSELQ